MPALAAYAFLLTFVARYIQFLHMGIAGVRNLEVMRSFCRTLQEVGKSPDTKPSEGFTPTSTDFIGTTTEFSVERLNKLNWGDAYAVIYSFHRMSKGRFASFVIALFSSRKSLDLKAVNSARTSATSTLAEIDEFTNGLESDFSLEHISHLELVPKRLNFANISSNEKKGQFRLFFLKDLKDFTVATHPECVWRGGISHWRLCTSKSTSTYVGTGTEDDVFGHRKKSDDLDDDTILRSQYDCNEPFPGAAISCSPVEPALAAVTGLPASEDTTDHRRAFFEMAARWGARYIIDLRHKRNVSGTHENAGQDYVSDPSMHDYLRRANEGSSPGRVLFVATPLIYGQGTDAGHKMCHVAVRNLPDNGVLQTQQLIALFNELDALEAVHGVGPVIYHCNGGLGRAPSILTLRTLWRVAKRACALGMRVVWDECRQEELVTGNTVNLAALLRRILVRGTHARSTFVQSQAQFEALPAFGRYLAENPSVFVPTEERAVASSPETA